MQLLSKAVGIDLGTTNSAVAVMNPTDTEIIIHRDSVAKRETTPSCVWKDPKTGNIVVGHQAFRRVGTTPSPIRSIKRWMGTANKVRLTDSEVTPQEVSAHILREMKRQIEEDITKLGTDAVRWLVDRAIVTVPAYFDTPQITATAEAGKLAGLEVIDLLHEPTAAACYHCWRTGTQNGLFLVYDLGGGTFDVSVLRCTAGTFEVLGISGNNRLGGDDLDAAIADQLLARLQKEGGYSLDLRPKDDPEDKLRYDLLKFLAESAKKALSTSSDFLLRDTGTLKDKDGNTVVVETMLERPELEEWIRPLIERTIPYCYEALDLARQKAKVQLSDVDAIVLAGGSTHVPLVREMVMEEFCTLPAGYQRRHRPVGDPVAGGKAKCEAPTYEKVDTVVALGAAVRAAAVGGLAVYNSERTVRVSFRGTAVTGARETHVGGKVEPIAAGLTLDGGRIKLRLDDLDYEDEQDLKGGGAFAFTRVPLQPGADNMLSFEVLDANGNQVAVAGRPVSQSREPVRPTGGGGGTAVLSKPISLEVTRNGQVAMRELFAAQSTLPASNTYQFSHPGGTELIRLPVFQKKRKIQEVRVPVPADLPKGTPIELAVNVDTHCRITARGRIGEGTFDFLVEPPPDRPIPTADDATKLDRAFKEQVGYLPTGKKAVVEARYKKAKQSFEAAAARADQEQAVHDFEELEDILAEISKGGGGLQPPKSEFDELVAECHEMNTYAAKVAAEKGKPFDHVEIGKAIDAQRAQGHKAWADGEQKPYGDAITMLESIQNHLVGLIRSVAPPPEISDTDRAAGLTKIGQQEAQKVNALAQAQGRKDLQDETEQIKRQLDALATEAQKNPRGVQEKASGLRARLEQIKNMLFGKKTDSGSDGKTVEDV